MEGSYQLGEVGVLQTGADSGPATDVTKGNTRVAVGGHHYPPRQHRYDQAARALTNELLWDVAFNKPHGSIMMFVLLLLGGAFVVSRFF